MNQIRNKNLVIGFFILFAVAVLFATLGARLDVMALRIISGVFMMILGFFPVNIAIILIMFTFAHDIYQYFLANYSGYFLQKSRWLVRPQIFLGLLIFGLASMFGYFMVYLMLTMYIAGGNICFLGLTVWKNCY